MTLPDLNSATQDGSTSSGMFLRGGPTSGILQEDATAINGLSIGGANGRLVSGGVDGGPAEIPGGGLNYRNLNAVTLQSTDTETRPANMSVVWIMRIK